MEKFHAGSYEKGYQYQYFLPNAINTAWGWESPQINQLVEKAAIKLGELNSFARLVPNIDLFIQLHVTKEAVISSRIEGTQTNMDEALLPEEEIDPERRNDWREVNNYILALNQATTSLKNLPLSSRLLKQTHETLLCNVRGEHKLPGCYRTSQNWIGGNSLADAVFIPPAHHHVESLMGDLENFLHNDQIYLPALVRVAIAHYQFETIHPFLDGNGRIGRLMITLFLVSEGILDQPLLYLSSYFEKNKALYYDNLMRVRTHHDMQQWLKYFLVGVEQTATQGVKTLTEILKLKADIEQLIHQHFGRRATTGMLLLQHLFQRPVINVEQSAGVCQVNYRPANELVALFQQHKILREMTGQSRNRLFVFDPYLRVFDQKDNTL
ncbi:Fic family protein [Thiothrix eikelboomii]|uniref:Fic family protein n=1 Tax=Thiothrix eikelboomii TaxID=92487 RepID=UPI003BAEFDA0